MRFDLKHAGGRRQNMRFLTARPSALAAFTPELPQANAALGGRPSSRAAMLGAWRRYVIADRKLALDRFVVLDSQPALRRRERKSPLAVSRRKHQARALETSAPVGSFRCRTNHVRSISPKDGAAGKARGLVGWPGARRARRNRNRGRATPELLEQVKVKSASTARVIGLGALW